MKHFEMSMMIAVFTLPILATIVVCLIMYGWNHILVFPITLFGVLAYVFHIAFTDELEEYRKNTSERV